MRIDSQGNQLAEPGDLVSVATGPRSCGTCGRWRAVKLDGRLVCCGCERRVLDCSCEPILS